MFIGGGLFVLGIIFLTVVAPIWIIAHYVTHWRASRRLSAGDEKALGELWQIAQRMEGRIQTLERILDNEAPGWRMRAGG
jgi:phage shock protein B